MRRVAYIVRHGKHKGNILTLEGVAQVQAAAEAITADMNKVGYGDDPTVFCSQEPRAVQSGAIVAAALGCRFKDFSVKGQFNPAAGLGKAIIDGKLPNPGQGFVRAWCEANPEGVEGFSVVKKRATSALQAILAFMVHPIIVTHGGVIEPLISGMTGADDHDMAEGEVAAVEIADDPQETTTVRFLNRPGA